LPPSNSPPQGLRTPLLMLVALALVWGANWPIMKIAVLGVEPWMFRAMCTLGGGIGMLALSRAGGHAILVPRDQFLWLAAIAPFSIGGWMVFSALGVGLMGSGRAAILAYTMPLWAVLFARFVLKEPLTPGRLLGLALGMAAIAVLLSHDFSMIEDSPLGAFFMLCAAVTWALGAVLFKRAPWRLPVMVIVGWQLVLVGIPVTVVALLTEPLPTQADLWAWLAVAYNIGPSGILGFYLWNRVLILLPAGAAAVGSLAVPVIGVMAGALVLGEVIGWREWTALLLVSTAIATVMGALPGANRVARPSGGA
jgi:drug/metabolite transporter (DMT)-like permease